MAAGSLVTPGSRPWPFPADGPAQRARRLAHAYRERLKITAPEACQQLDDMAIAMGETWVAPRVLRCELDDELAPAEAADLAGVNTGTIRQWRHRGRLAGTRGADGKWRYRARDVLAAMSPTARRLATPGVSAA